MNLNTTIISSFLVFITLLSSVVHSKLIVVADLGGTSTSRYFTIFNPEEEQNTPTLPQGVIEQQLHSPLSISAMLPVETPELTPGQAKNKALVLPNMRAIFLIGDDDFSQRWLELRRNRLKELNAVGYVVNVKDMQAWNSIKKYAEGLEILPIPGSDLAQRLNLTHYPILISSQGVEQ